MRRLLTKSLRMARYNAKSYNVARHRNGEPLRNYQKSTPAVRNWNKFILTDV